MKKMYFVCSKISTNEAFLSKLANDDEKERQKKRKHSAGNEIQ
jgi:hypothetical protein